MAYSNITSCLSVATGDLSSPCFGLQKEYRHAKRFDASEADRARMVLLLGTTNSHHQEGGQLTRRATSCNNTAIAFNKSAADKPALHFPNFLHPPTSCLRRLQESMWSAGALYRTLSRRSNAICLLIFRIVVDNKFLYEAIDPLDLQPGQDSMEVEKNLTPILES